ncbi:hypothetical protein AXF42_Ash016145 [Apostasia shenzhenica]|uniref:DUF4378 domain-containing protein n=1 Tax=Apostasia shenzhenica TaxID=1088818 RepID=A0A2I0AEK6_9ASPA|nr:hypothetical protein AXF42_Ash016145 [Apostasia shenzhenica]
MAQRPLMLKEHLELDSKLESFRLNQQPQAAGATVRSLLQKELLGDPGGSVAGLFRSRPNGTLTRLSAVIRAVRMLRFGHGGSIQARHLRRSSSQNLKRQGYFWGRGRRSCDADVSKKRRKVLLKEFVRLRAFDNKPADMASIVRSSLNFSSSSDGGGGLFIDGKQESTPGSTNGVGVSGEIFLPSAGSGSREPKEICHKEIESSSEEGKEQLSPVSVMDFPFQAEEEEDDVAHPLNRCISRTEHQSLMKIRRFASHAELDAVDPSQLLTCGDDCAEPTDHAARGEDEAEDEEPTLRTAASMLVGRLAGGETIPKIAEKLLHDFFAEGLSMDEHRRCRRMTKNGGSVEEELLRVATGRLAGDGEIAADVDMKVAALREMERRGGWSSFEEEGEAVAEDVAGGLLTWLMEELVND